MPRGMNAKEYAQARQGLDKLIKLSSALLDKVYSGNHDINIHVHFKIGVDEIKEQADKLCCNALNFYVKKEDQLKRKVYKP